MKNILTYIFLPLMIFTSCVNTDNKPSSNSDSNRGLLGFWRFDKIIQGSTSQLCETEDIYFTSKYWYELDYPICFNHFFKFSYSVQGDSLFRYTSNGTFKYKIDLNGDTLIISYVYDTKDLYELRYFIRSSYNSVKLEEILKYGFNPDTLTGIFKYYTAYNNEDIKATDLNKIEAECSILDTIDLSFMNRRNFVIKGDTLIYILRNVKYFYKIEDIFCNKCTDFSEIHLCTLFGSCDRRYNIAYKKIN